MPQTPRTFEPECEWTAPDVACESAWTETLGGSEREELDRALETALAKSSDILEVSRDDFPLPGLSKRLLSIGRSLIDVHGFVRYIPPYILASQRYSETPRLGELEKRRSPGSSNPPPSPGAR